MLQRKLNDTITLIKVDGSQSGTVKALVQPELIFITDTHLPIEEGDTLRRELPNGVIEDFTVLERGYSRKVGSIPEHYQCKVKKKSRVKADSSSVDTRTIYNVSGPNCRVVINSTDNSTNTVSLSERELFSQLREIAASIESDDESISEEVDKMESAVGTPSFAQAYASFISVISAHVSLFAPFLPALTQLME